MSVKKMVLLKISFGCLAVSLITIILIISGSSASSLAVLLSLHKCTLRTVTEQAGAARGGRCNSENFLGSTERGRLLWAHRSYISYGALTADRVPCPAMSGRSYYTSDCYKSNGPVRPYTRGCTAITRCWRDSS
eukprot:c17217_g1_i1 orf=542-943(+)